MKKMCMALACLAVMAGCNQQHTSLTQKKAE